MSFAARRVWGELASPPGPPPPPPTEVVLVDANLFSVVLSPGVASFSYSVNNDGTLVAFAQSGSQSYDWLNSGAASDYQIRWSPSPGSSAPDTGVVNEWLSLSSNRVWSALVTSGGFDYSAFVEIRSASTSAVLASANLNIFLEVAF